MAKIDINNYGVRPKFERGELVHCYNNALIVIVDKPIENEQFIGTPLTDFDTSLQGVANTFNKGAFHKFEGKITLENE